MSRSVDLHQHVIPGFCWEAPNEDGDAAGAITPSPGLPVQHTRPIVADLVGSGRMGLGTLLAPADPLVIIDGLCYRLDADMSACRVSPLERVRCATVVDFRHGRRFRIDYSVRRASVAELASHVLGTLHRIVAVELSGTFSGVTVPNGTFGRTAGRAVGFVTRIPSERNWHLSLLTADRTFGGPILEISIENVELKVVAPRVVYQARTGQSPKSTGQFLPTGVACDDSSVVMSHRQSTTLTRWLRSRDDQRAS